jgi:predicted CXXCH cytochrome family protein
VTQIGKNLTGDHPISVTYNNNTGTNSSDAAFNDASTVIAAGLPLYGVSRDQVECGSCHNPHEDTLPTFYRISNAGSDMCTTCHIK